MTWGEANRLVEKLTRDPGTWLCASLNRWEYPFSRQEQLLADLFDAFGSSKVGKKHKPHPLRPTKRKAEKVGKTTLTAAQSRAVLARMRAGLIRD